MNGDLFPLRDAFSRYLHRWYDGLYPDTKAMQEFTVRGIGRAIAWAPGRMVDEAEKMLEAYRKNNNTGVPNKGALLPVVLVALAKDYTPTGGDWGGRQVGRQLVRLTDESDASVYGYRQAMADIRAQVVIFAAEEVTAKSLAAQFSLFVGEVPHRRFTAQHAWGQYTLDVPVMIESPDLMFAEVKTEQSNITILAADLTLKAVIPYLDAPKPGEPNDGSGRNPPGYRTVDTISLSNGNTGVSNTVREIVPLVFDGSWSFDGQQTFDGVRRP